MHIRRTTPVIRISYLYKCIILQMSTHNFIVHQYTRIVLVHASSNHNKYIFTNAGRKTCTPQTRGWSCSSGRYIAHYIAYVSDIILCTGSWNASPADEGRYRGVADAHARPRIRSNKIGSRAAAELAHAQPTHTYNQEGYCLTRC